MYHKQLVEILEEENLVVFGKPRQAGVTTFIRNYITHNLSDKSKMCLYVSFRGGFNPTVEMEIDCESLFLGDIMGIEYKLKNRRFEYIFIDSCDIRNVDLGDLIKILSYHSKKIFIFTEYENIINDAKKLEIKTILIPSIRAFLNINFILPPDKSFFMEVHGIFNSNLGVKSMRNLIEAQTNNINLFSDILNDMGTNSEINLNHYNNFFNILSSGNEERKLN